MDFLLKFKVEASAMLNLGKLDVSWIWTVQESEFPNSIFQEIKKKYYNEFDWDKIKRVKMYHYFFPIPRGTLLFEGNVSVDFPMKSYWRVYKALMPMGRMANPDARRFDRIFEPHNQDYWSFGWKF